MEPVPDFDMLPPRRFRVSEYYKMAELGLLDEDERVELLEGVIVQMTPQSVRHANVISRLTDRLTEVLPRSEYAVRIQLPLRLDDRNEPEPDVAVVTRAAARNEESHPSTALLVIEVALGSWKKDRELKSMLYARAGVNEYGIVDLARKTFEVLTQPDISEQRYLQSRTLKLEETWVSSVLPGVQLPIAALFEA